MGSRQVERRIKEELENYPVKFTFGEGGKHPYVEISFNGRSECIPYSLACCDGAGTNWYNLRSNLRQKMREMGADRIGALGKKILEVAKPEAKLAEVAFSHPVFQQPAVVNQSPEHQPKLELIVTPEQRKADPAPRILPVEPLSSLRPIERKPEPPKEAAMAINGISRPAPTSGKPVAKLEASTPQMSKLLHSEVVQITLLISQNADIDHTKRLVRYKPGWDDERILKILRTQKGREHLKLTTVQDLRRTQIGHVPAEIARAAASQHSGGIVRTLVAEVAELKARIEALEGAIVGPQS